MFYEPFPFGRVCHVCGAWKPRAAMKKMKRLPFGVETTCLACAKAINMAWAHAHPDIVQESRDKWYDAHEEQAKATATIWRKNNRDKVNASGDRWAKNHPDRAAAKVQKRNARIRELPHTLTENDWQRCLIRWDNRCAYCGGTPSPHQKTQVLIREHFIPVPSGGGYTPDNIVPACKSCNSRKLNSDPIEWTRKRFGEDEAIAILARIAAYFEWIKAQS